jgi:hypothetical protein
MRKVITDQELDMVFDHWAAGVPMTVEATRVGVAAARLRVLLRGLHPRRYAAVISKERANHARAAALAKPKKELTPEMLEEVFQSWEMGSIIKREARRLGVGEKRLLAALHQADRRRCAGITRAQHSRNARSRGAQTKKSVTRAPKLRVRPSSPPMNQDQRMSRMRPKRSGQGGFVHSKPALVEDPPPDIKWKPRRMDEFTTEELEALLVKARVVLNGHTGHVPVPFYPECQASD